MSDLNMHIKTAIAFQRMKIHGIGMIHFYKLEMGIRENILFKVILSLSWQFSLVIVLVFPAVSY
jgi:hypothetical protein